ncbi:alpha/beta-hydrolase [Atractiella rhizophila]|nr:alpha/beta-hydrolase [Atractiella rhizophila]
MSKIEAPYGSWVSPITPEVVIKSGSSSGPGLQVDSHGGIYLLESRADEGRSVICQFEDGVKSDVVGKDVTVGSKVHEYGGGAWEVKGDRIVYAHSKNLAVWIMDRKESKWGNAVRVTPESSAYRYADFSIHPHHPELILSILEDHTIDTPSTVVNSLILINTLQGTSTQIAGGNDFYSAPRWSPNGKYVSFLTWNFPDMPFEATELWIGEVEPSITDKKDQRFWKSNPVKIAGELKGGEVIDQPLWLPSKTEEQRIVFLSDRSNWKNFQVYSTLHKEVRPVLREVIEADFVGPAWQVGRRQWSPLSSTAFVGFANGQLHLFDVEGQTSKTFDLPDVAVVEAIHAVTDSGSQSGKVLLTARNYSKPPTLCAFDFDSKQFSILLHTGPSLDPSHLSTGTLFTFPTSHSFARLTDQAIGYARFYPPTSANYKGPENLRPPAIIFVHGGPTGSSKFHYNLSEVQFYTSRGFAVVLVEYGGTVDPGYGREYRKRLDEGWGVIDRLDCENAVKWLIEKGWIDASRVAIAGISSGGYCVLLSLCSSTIWTAGICSYGIADLVPFFKETHKYESHYTSILPADNFDQVLKERSPINHIEKITAPVLLLQGADDRVVPPNQAMMMKEVLERNNVPVELVLFEGEAHGWRQAKTVEAAMNKQIEFLRNTWGIKDIGK